MGNALPLPANVHLVDAAGKDCMSFVLTLGVDVSASSDAAHINIRVGNLLFSAAGPIAKQFITNATPTELRDTISLLTLAATKFVVDSPASSYDKLTPSQQQDDNQGFDTAAKSPPPDYVN